MRLYLDITKRQNQFYKTTKRFYKNIKFPHQLINKTNAVINEFITINTFNTNHK